MATDLARPDPLPQPQLADRFTHGETIIHDILIEEITGATIVSLYAGGSGWVPDKVPEVCWPSAEYVVSLTHAGKPDGEAFRYGADVAAGAAAAMFTLLVSAFDQAKPVRVTCYRPGGNELPVLLSVQRPG